MVRENERVKKRKDLMTKIDSTLKKDTVKVKEFEYLKTQEIPGTFTLYDEVRYAKTTFPSMSSKTLFFFFN